MRLINRAAQVKGNKGTCDGANAPPQVPSNAPPQVPSRPPSTYSLFLAPAHLERRPISGAGPSLAPAVPS